MEKIDQVGPDDFQICKKVSVKHAVEIDRRGMEEQDSEEWCRRKEQFRLFSERRAAKRDS